MVQARSAKQAHRLKIAFALAGVYLVAEVIMSFTTGSLALLADAGHMLTDVVGVGLALFAITLAQRPATPGRTYGYHRAEWYYADPIVSAGIGLFILPRTWRLMRDATGILLEGTPADISLGAVREALTKVEGVLSVHDLHVWSLTSGLNALSAHVVRSADASHDVVLARAHDAVMAAFPIAHVTIQLGLPGWEQRETHL